MKKSDPLDERRIKVITDHFAAIRASIDQLHVTSCTACLFHLEDKQQDSDYK